MIGLVVRAVLGLAASVAMVFSGANVLRAIERESVTLSYSMNVDGLTRSWEEIMPVAQLPKSAPVIVVLSGISASVSDEISRDDLVPYANADDAELVYPVGYDESWNAGGCCGNAATANVNDVAFLKALAARVDPGRVHPLDLVGYSNGGRMAYRMACSAPGVFGEIAVVKAMPMPGCVVTRPQTFLQVDALNDPAVAYAPGYPGEETPQATVEVGQLSSTDGCTGQVAAAHGRMRLTSYGGCADGTRLEFAVYSTGGHDFPQASRTTPGAAAVIWAFFTDRNINHLPALRIPIT